MNRDLAMFKEECTFLLGVAKFEQLPKTTLPEFAFVGRSNVGKSSLINALLNKRKIARTSCTPGRTQQLNFFNLNNHLLIVDLPGYGFAKAPKQMVEQWQFLAEDYLKTSVNLKKIFLLIDSRHGIKSSDYKMMETLDKMAIIFQIVLTKTDKAKKTELEKNLKDVKEAIAKHAAAASEPILTSSEKNKGIEELQMQILNML